MKAYLPFEHLPKGLPLSRKVRYCILDISGIQRYIFHGMDRSSTPAHVRRRSQYIQALTGTLLERLQMAFPKGMLFSSASSGKILCGFCSRLREGDIRTFLDRLQRQVFASTEGRLTFYYALCEAVCIPMGKFRSDAMIHAGEMLSALLARQKLGCRNLLDTDMAEDYDPRLREETLVSAGADTAPIATDMAAVKLDLDNLGAFFRDITAFDLREKISTALDKAIAGCLAADGRIDTIFAGGDDIFFLCPLLKYPEVVAVFRQRLQSALLQDPLLAGYGKEHFGISAGICAVRAAYQSPMVLYWEQSEDALGVSKGAGGKNCVCLILPDGERRLLGWEGFCLISTLYTRLLPKLLESRALSAGDLMDIYWLRDRLLAHSRQEKSPLTEKEWFTLANIDIQLL